MLKKSSIIVVLLLCLSVWAVSAEDAVVSQKSVSPGEVYLYGSGCQPDKTTVTIEVDGYGGGGTSDTLAVVFAIDSSGSMSLNDPFDLRLLAADAFVDKMLATPENDKGGVVSWDNGIDFTYGLVEESVDSFATLKTQINSVDSVGGTDLNDGLNAAISMMDAESAVTNKVIIFLTDGDGTYTYSGSPGSPADAAAAKGYVIYTIGLNIESPSTPETKLMEIASVTGGTYFPSPDASNLDAIFAAVYAGVASTAPYNVDLTEVTESYIVEEADFSIAPDSVVENGDGTTTMVWTNIAQYVGNMNDRLDATETFVVTFTAGSDTVGTALPVDNLTTAVITYTDPLVGGIAVPVGQAYLDVLECPPPTTIPTTQPTPPPTSVPEFPVMVLPIGLIGGLFVILYALRR